MNKSNIKNMVVYNKPNLPQSDKRPLFKQQEASVVEAGGVSKANTE